MPIYLWEGKILIVDGKIAIHERCCCDDKFYCTVEFMSMYDCDTGEWIEDSNGNTVAVGYVWCTTTDMTTPGGWTGPWTPEVFNPFSCPENHTCCLLGQYDSVEVASCEISTPQGPYCDTLDTPPLPDKPLIPTLQDLKDHCPCYADCPSDNCYPSQPHCLWLTIDGDDVSGVPWVQVWGDANGDCSHSIECLWQEGGSYPGDGWEDEFIECINGKYKIRLDTFLSPPEPASATYQKSAAGGVTGTYVDIENDPPQPPLDVEIFDDGQGGCDCFLIFGGCPGPGGGDSTPGGTVIDLASWKSAGCPTVFSAPAHGEGSYCWDITGRVVTPNYGFTPLASVGAEYFDCESCLGDLDNLRTGYYYIIEYLYDAGSTGCSGFNYVQECCLYNGSVFVSSTNSINIPSDYSTCLDSGDGRSTKFFGFPTFAFGPWPESTCGGWTP